MRNGRPLAVAYGIGQDSTAALVGMYKRGIRPDIIQSGDAGGEKEETYQYLDVINAWLRSVGFPEVQVVRYTPEDFKHWPPYYSLEENCLTNGTLPSISFGFNSCSQKWKHQPQHENLKRIEMFRALWDTCLHCNLSKKFHKRMLVPQEGKSERKAVHFCWAGGPVFECGKVIKMIGYDCSPRDRQRQRTYACMAAHGYDQYAHLYEYWYPLQEWGWDRARCVAEIQSVGLPVPLKSSCFFCIAMKPEEVAALPADKLRRIVLLEARAKPRLTSVTGLWRSAIKGKKKGSIPRPGSMTEFIVQEGLLPAAEVARIQQVPVELVAFQEAEACKALGDRIPLGEFLHERFPDIFVRRPQIDVSVETLAASAAQQELFHETHGSQAA